MHRVTLREDYGKQPSLSTHFGVTQFTYFGTALADPELERFWNTLVPLPYPSDHRGAGPSDPVRPQIGDSSRGVGGGRTTEAHTGTIEPNTESTEMWAPTREESGTDTDTSSDDGAPIPNSPDITGLTEEEAAEVLFLA